MGTIGGTGGASKVPTPIHQPKASEGHLKETALKVAKYAARVFAVLIGAPVVCALAIAAVPFVGMALLSDAITRKMTAGDLDT